MIEENFETWFDCVFVKVKVLKYGPKEFLTETGATALEISWGAEDYKLKGFFKSGMKEGECEGEGIGDYKGMKIKAMYVKDKMEGKGVISKKLIFGENTER